MRVVIFLDKLIKFLVYPDLIPVKNVSWMLLSAGVKLEPRSGLRGEGCLH